MIPLMTLFRLLMLAISAAAVHGFKVHLSARTSAVCKHPTRVKHVSAVSSFDYEMERFGFLGIEAVERLANLAENAFDEMGSMQWKKDKALVDRDMKSWCIDRCLTLGYCEVVEDLLDMTSAQVRTFCGQCSSTDECELEYV